MCGRFVSLTYDEVEGVIKSIQMDSPFNVDPDWPVRRPSAYPGSIVPVIARESGLLVPEDLKWGFEVEWRKGLVFNTRMETALGPKPGMWKRPMSEGRCIVAAAGFFEPHASETRVSPKTGKEIKRQYFFEEPDGAPMLLAAVRDESAFSLVTTEPNRWVAPVHKRMPLVLRCQDVPIWLDGDYASLADRSEVALEARPEDAMAA